MPMRLNVRFTKRSPPIELTPVASSLISKLIRPSLLHVEDATREIAGMQSAIPAEEVEAGLQYKSRRPNLNFREMGISVGSLLQFTESDATVAVSSERKVILAGDELSLTAATRQLLGLDYSVQPGPYWTFEGKSLRAIYEETYGP
jgi:hypothetical protein